MTRALHVVALPHTTLTEKHSTCAYSTKVGRWVKMMRAQECRVILYGPDEIDCEPDEHVVITTQADRQRWGFGDGFDTAKTPFLWDWNQPYWFEANTRAIDALKARVEPRDYLCLTTGTQLPIAQAVSGPGLNNPIAVEWAVGYEGPQVSFRAFESYAWMHHVYGIRGIRNGAAYDQVIPNFFDVAQFPTVRKPSRDYLLFMGRVVQRKGPQIASQIAERLGMKLVVAGPGGVQNRKQRSAGEMFTHEGDRMTGDVEYVGEVGYQERAKLMGNAACLLAPTIYVEPFGGVAVEAMLCGTPVVASDWGSFTEIVSPESGRRFRTLQQGCDAATEALTLNPKRIRDYATGRFSLEAVGPMFSRWFNQLDGLWGAGWSG